MAAVQSCYVPWKGYFDIIHDVDIFIFHDCVQYTKQDWRNRNQIFLDGKKIWLTVPVKNHPVSAQVNQVEIDQGQLWAEKHYRLIEETYRTAPFFKEVMDLLDPVLGRKGSAKSTKLLSSMNQTLTRKIALYLGIKTEFINSAELNLRGRGTDRLIDILDKVDGKHYVTGSKAKEYIEPQKFVDNEIELVYKDYSNYPDYPQFSSTMSHQVSILDLLFQVGSKSADYIWGWRK